MKIEIEKIGFISDKELVKLFHAYSNINNTEFSFKIIQEVVSRNKTTDEDLLKIRTKLIG